MHSSDHATHRRCIYTEPIKRTRAPPVLFMQRKHRYHLFLSHVSR